LTQSAENHHNIMESLFRQSLDYLRSGGDVSIFIPWATTNSKRELILSKTRLCGLNIEVLFLENICDDMMILKQNLSNKISYTPYLKQMPTNNAATYLQDRIMKYYKAYETITDDNLSYIKIINLKSKIISNRVYSKLSTQVMSLLMSIHLDLRPIWLVAEKSRNDRNGVKTQEQYLESLKQFIEKRIPTKLNDLMIFYSPAATQTVQKLGNYGKRVSTNILDHINRGICNNITLQEFETKYPELFKQWKNDAFNFRYPNGESYSDLVQRLDPFILQVERHNSPLMIVADETVIRILYCYFIRNKEVVTSPYIEIPRYTVIELASTQAGWTERAYRLIKE